MATIAEAGEREARNAPTYFKARWIHDAADDPSDLCSEIDANRNELRKVYVFRDGHMEAASKTIQMGSTFLGLMPIPPLEEINAQPEFEARPISREAFERVWSAAVGPRA